MNEIESPEIGKQIESAQETFEQNQENSEARKFEVEEAHRLEDTKKPLEELSNFVKRVREFFNKLGKK